MDTFICRMNQENEGPPLPDDKQPPSSATRESCWQRFVALFSRTNRHNVRVQEPVPPFDISEHNHLKAKVVKAYVILIVQLLVILGFIALFLFNQQAKEFLKHREQFWIICVSAVLALSYFCTNFRQRAPKSLVFLTIYTVATSVSLGGASVLLDTYMVLIGVVLTIASCFVLLVYVFASGYYYCIWGGLLASVLGVSSASGIIYDLFPELSMSVLYAALGTLLFSLYIVHDTQLTLKRKEHCKCCISLLRILDEAL